MYILSVYPAMSNMFFIVPILQIINFLVSDECIATQKPDNRIRCQLLLDPICPQKVTSHAFFQNVRRLQAYLRPVGCAHHQDLVTGLAPEAIKLQQELSLQPP